MEGYIWQTSWPPDSLLILSHQGTISFWCGFELVGRKWTFRQMA
jgi:hypothetical protein